MPASVGGARKAALTSPTPRSEILLATTNAGKIAELRLLLPEFRLTTPFDMELRLEVVEDGNTFCENAFLKARAFAEASGKICLADDSGLEVDAFDGAPGILSARFGGESLDDEARCQLLLASLQQVSEPEARTARFVCCALVVAPDGRSCQGKGKCEGQIAFEMSGEGGFGYDPVFYLPYLGVTMATLSAAEKNQLSHRTKAVAAVRDHLFTTFPELQSATQ